MYQPPTQIPLVLEKVCDESYRPLLEVFRQHPHAKATVNINGVLLEMLQDYGHGHLVDSLRELGERGQVEFTGSSKYHAILPLIPPAERKMQIDLNRRSGRNYLRKAYAPRGFFPPEMCYSSEVLPEVKAAGHEWIILSGIACPAAWPVDKVYQVEHEGKRLAVFFRDDILSNKISFKQIGPKEFLEHLRQMNGGGENMYVITAMDAETYGHHIQNWEKIFLATIYEQLQAGPETYAGIKQATELASQESTLLDSSEFTQLVKMVTISELLEIFPLGEVVAPKPSSWSTSAEDLAAGNYYPLWWDKDNEIHRLQWEHLRICIEMVNAAVKASDDGESKLYASIARRLLDRAEHSCQFWWASRRPMWDVNLIHLGLIDQWRVVVNAYRAINISRANGDIKRDHYQKLVAARDLRNKITDRLFIL
jgi:alpha-amylase/alpha-mannosidase (GH57 family)